MSNRVNESHGDKSTSIDRNQPESNASMSWNDAYSEIHSKKVRIAGSNSEQEPKDKFFADLSKRFVTQQDQIIAHRKSLLRWFAWITASQLVVINVLIFICIFGSSQALNILLSFLKFFVGATFLELLGGLLIIVKFVFSRETYDMLTHLTHVKPSDKD